MSLSEFSCHNGLVYWGGAAELVTLTSLHDIFSRTADAVFVVDSRCEIVYQNQVFADIFQLHTSALFHRKCYEVLCGRTLDGERFCNPDCPVGKTLLNGQTVENFDLAVPRDKGEPLRVSVGSMPVSKISGKAAAIFMLRPISASRTLFPPVNDKKRTDSIPPDIEHRLTLREQQILTLLAKGHNTRALANALHISYVTARNHVQHIYEKLGVHNRAEAVSYVFRNGLLR